MKVHYSKSKGSSGSSLILTLVVTGLIGLTLATYLNLVRSQNLSTMRSQTWNASIPVIEAGIEDALTHLNVHGETNLVCDGWTKVGSLYVVQRPVGANYYVVAISNYVAGASNQTPVIESRGFVDAPLLVASAQNAFLAAAWTPDTTKKYLGRGVRTTTKKSALFAKGLVAKGQVNMNGNNIDTDSFDSSDTNYSTGGKYVASKNKDNGDVATNSGLTNSVNVGNANILGHVSTGPGGSVKIGSTGSIGDKAWNGADGIKPGWTTDDMNVTFDDVGVPFTSAYFPYLDPGMVGGTNYDYVLTGGNYQVSSLSMSGHTKMRVTGNSILYVTGNFSLAGNAYIELSPGVTLQLYVGGSGSIAGNGVLNPGTAINFQYLGLPTSTSLSMSGNAAFTGVVYAPSAALSLSGGGSSDYDFVGASITKTVTMNGHFKFHYDEALAKYGPGKGYIVTSWNEMTPQEVAVVPPLH